MLDYQTVLRDVHVLVVDDAEDELELLKVALQSCGAVVSAAQSVEQAKQIFMRHQPQVVVTDIAMPNDGLGLIQAVRAETERLGRKVPAIAVTGLPERRTEVLAAGFDALVPKPLDPMQLCLVVKKHIG
jgi:CheY-like chemotaxis protein